MAKYSKKQDNPKPSPETVEVANSIAQGIQKPGQTKEQTKLISQGIQKGIEQFKKQQKHKSKQLEKNSKKRILDKSEVGEKNSISTEYKQHWLAWLLLTLSWIGFGLYCLLI